MLFHIDSYASSSRISTNDSMSREHALSGTLMSVDAPPTTDLRLTHCQAAGGVSITRNLRDVSHLWALTSQLPETELASWKRYSSGAKLCLTDLDYITSQLQWDLRSLETLRPTLAPPCSTPLPVSLVSPVSPVPHCLPQSLTLFIFFKQGEMWETVGDSEELGRLERPRRPGEECIGRGNMDRLRNCSD